jgi:hypothetical protein
LNFGYLDEANQQRKNCLTVESYLRLKKLDFEPKEYIKKSILHVALQNIFNSGEN